MARKEREQEQFVVSDKRKFTAEGELRPEAPPQPEEPQQTTEAPAAESPAPPSPEARVSEVAAKNGEQMPPPPSAAEQQAQHDDYQKAGKQIDSMLDAAGAQRPPDTEMTFERLIASLYMQAMMQLGMLREENVQPQPDLIGARQTIDTISLLHDKTKGNLTDREANMLQNVLFELRMAFLEITNILTRPPSPGAKPGAPGEGAKK
jgi:uncharacterized protein DUF1844